MTSTKIKPSRLTTTGLCTILTLVSLLTACNLTQAQEQSPLKQRRLERVNRRQGGATANLGNMTLESISYQGQTRTYYIHTPNSYQPNKPLPLVLAFHGGVGQGNTMAQKTGFNEVADREGFIVVYPNGINGGNGGRWNDGRLPSKQSSQADDVGFIGALIDHLVQVKNVDSRRVYATGGSNGGFFTQRLACEMSNKIAAFASVSATLPKALQSRCNPPKAIPMLMINGTADPFVPWNGGQVRIGAGGEILSVPATVDFWRKHDACSASASVEQLPIIRNDGTRVEKTVYTGCRNNLQMVFFKVDGGGHGWPESQSSQRSEARSGKITQNLNASDAIWKFFQRQTLQ